VPPALPLSITVCTAIAIQRLKKAKIYTTSPPVVNTAGRIDCICFDKTGTLTSESLNMIGVQPVAGRNMFGSMIEPDLVYDTLIPDISSKQDLVESNFMLLCCMATAHNLVNIDGEIMGDPLELEIFKAARGSLYELDKKTEIADGYMLQEAVRINNPNRYLDTPYFFGDKCLDFAILRRFDFSSQLKRMSVIVRDMKHGRNYIFVKGSPEHLKLLSKKNSLPDEYNLILHQVVDVRRRSFEQDARFLLTSGSVGLPSSIECWWCDQDSVRQARRSCSTGGARLVQESRRPASRCARRNRWRGSFDVQ